MKYLTLSRLAASLVLCGLTGCATVSTMRAAPPQEGVSRTFVAEASDVEQTVRQIIARNQRLEFVDSQQIDQRSWVIIAKEGMSAFSWGTLVRIFIEQINDTETTVRVVTKRRLATNITAKGDYSSEILGFIPAELQKREALAH